MWEPSNFALQIYRKTRNFGRRHFHNHPGSPTFGEKTSPKQATCHEVPPEPDTLKLTFTGLGFCPENEDVAFGTEINFSQQKWSFYIDMLGGIFNAHSPINLR